MTAPRSRPESGAALSGRPRLRRRPQAAVPAATTMITARLTVTGRSTRGEMSIFTPMKISRTAIPGLRKANRSTEPGQQEIQRPQAEDREGVGGERHRRIHW